VLKENVIFQEENVKTFGSKKKNSHSGKCFKCENKTNWNVIKTVKRYGINSRVK
jgi:hypothetical protein